MNKIGFQNFRRFKNFEPLEYKGITFLVGRNNSGKSTMVKALLLINEFFKSGSIKTFSFGNSVLEDANIVAYKRALNNSANSDFIVFTYQIDEYLINITITSDPDTTEGKVEHISIKDSVRNIQFEIEAKISGITISKINDGKIINLPGQNNAVTDARIRIQEIEKALQEDGLEKSSKKYISLVDNLNNIKEKLNRISDYSNKVKDSEPFSVTTFFPEELGLKDAIEASIVNILAYHDIDFRKTENGEEPSENFPNYHGFKFGLAIINESYKSLFKVVASNSIIYLGANPTKQSALFAIRDKNNALAQAIHNFGPTKESEFDVVYKWACTWMLRFNVGETFTITIHAGEAYEVIVYTGGKGVQLADMGMGSIQAMLLILRLASIIRKVKDLKEHHTLVIIEEPELNLHPALQSELAHLFDEVHYKFNINFIIETHSEYLIRETQFLVKDKSYESFPIDNPFCIIYFDNDKRWKMNYRFDGKFIEEFGSGFFDQTRNIIRKTMQE